MNMKLFICTVVVACCVHVTFSADTKNDDSKTRDQVRDLTLMYSQLEAKMNAYQRSITEKIDTEFGQVRREREVIKKDLMERIEGVMNSVVTKLEEQERHLLDRETPVIEEALQVAR